MVSLRLGLIGIMNMEKKVCYIAPEIEVLSITIESPILDGSNTMSLMPGFSQEGLDDDVEDL